MSIWSELPGSAPVTSTGPLTWSTRSKSSVSRSAAPIGGQLPVRGVRQSNPTTAPDDTVATGGIAGSQARWVASRATWMVAVVTFDPP